MIPMVMFILSAGIFISSEVPLIGHEGAGVGERVGAKVDTYAPKTHKKYKYSMSKR
jgi:Zn-dependent alcohol dehydrogenase